MAPKPAAHRRADGSVAWRVRFRLAPATNPVSETFETAEDAYAFAALIEQIGGAAARRARDAVDDVTDYRTVATATDHHLRMLEGSATAGTIEDYRRLAASTFLQPLGPIPLAALTTDDVIAWVAWQRRQTTYRGTPYAPKTIRNAHSVLSATLAREYRAGRVDRNVAERVPMPSDAERTREAVFLSANQFTALLGHVRGEYQTFVALLFATGLRFGEATALRPTDFDLDADVPVVRVVRAWKRGPGGRVELGSPKTRMARRTVSLPDSVTDSLRAHLAEVAPDKLAFTALRGGTLTTSSFHQTTWGPAVRAADLGVRPRVHDLRHSHASNLIAAGVSLPVIQRRLGHESIKTTVDTYGHLEPDALRLAARAADLSLVQALPQLEG